MVKLGQKFGYWTTLSQVDSFMYGTHAHRRWLCECICGTRKEILELSLRRGGSKSCGCMSDALNRQSNTRHGGSLYGKKTAEYNSWSLMRGRCLNPLDKRYRDYGGRGIGIDPHWDYYENFIADMGKKPTPQHSIDRIDNNKDYGPDNCKWSTPHEQMTNRSITRFVDTPQGRIPLATLAKEYEIPANTLRARILKGWSLEEALNKPVRPKRKQA